MFILRHLRFSTIRQHTDSRSGRLESRWYYYIMHCIFQNLAQCASLSGYEEDTQRTWSVTLLAPDAWLSKNIIRNALDTFRRQTKGSVGVWSDLSDGNMTNEARNRNNKKTVAIKSSTLLWLLVSIELLALPYILYVQTMIVCGDFFHSAKYWIEQFEVLPCPARSMGAHAVPL